MALRSFGTDAQILRNMHYSAAIKEILPDAMQIADRFHLHQNLLEAIRNTINSVLPNDIRIPTDSNIIAERSVENDSKKNAMQCG